MNGAFWPLFGLVSYNDLCFVWVYFEGLFWMELGCMLGTPWALSLVGF